MTRERWAYTLISLCLLLSIAACLLVFFTKSDAKTSTPRPKNVTASKNEKCLSCHGNRHYEMVKPTNNNKVIHGRMPQEYIIDTVKYIASSHGSFGCLDCHSSGYETVPHDPDARFESIPLCLDCHDPGTDTTWKKFNFPIIQSEYAKSVHCSGEHSHFTCWTCHDPHSTRLCARNDSMPLQDVVETSNAMCTKCHKMDKTDHNYRAHDMFPHTDLHLQKNRCIDCHTLHNDSLLVDHNVLDKHHATKNCSECHSGNSKVVKDFLRKRNNTGDTNSRMLMGYYSSDLISISIVVVLAILVLLVAAYVLWSLTRKKNEH